MWDVYNCKDLAYPLAVSCGDYFVTTIKNWQNILIDWLLAIVFVTSIKILQYIGDCLCDFC